MADQREILREVEEAYRHYVEVFNRRDPVSETGRARREQSRSTAGT